MNTMKQFRLLLLFMGGFCMFGFLKPESDLVGKKAPQFTAECLDIDGKIRQFDLKKYIGHLVVLYFYPMDDTPGCTKQAKNFKDMIEKLKAKGIILFGISCDSMKSHKKFQKKYGLPFALISDSRLKRSISKMYGVAGFLYAKRRTVLINKDGVVVKVFDSVNIETQIDDIVKAFNL